MKRVYYSSLALDLRNEIIYKLSRTFLPFY
nr:MAG TPA: CREB-binding protein [Microviridae sp. cttdF6]